MTREYLGRFSLLEVALQVTAVALFVAAMVWVFLGESSQEGWRWLMMASLALSVIGRFLHRRRLIREYGTPQPNR